VFSPFVQSVPDSNNGKHVGDRTEYNDPTEVGNRFVVGKAHFPEKFFGFLVVAVELMAREVGSVVAVQRAEGPVESCTEVADVVADVIHRREVLVFIGKTEH
jgi:hypothetical protein